MLRGKRWGKDSNLLKAQSLTLMESTWNNLKETIENSEYIMNTVKLREVKDNFR